MNEEIKLYPGELARAKIDPLPPPIERVTRIWDRDEFLARLRTMGAHDASPVFGGGPKTDAALWPSREEASFWLDGCGDLGQRHTRVATLLEKVLAFSPDAFLSGSTPPRLRNRAALTRLAPRFGLRCLLTVGGPTALAAILFDLDPRFRDDVLKALRTGVLPFLSSRERDEFRRELIRRSDAEPGLWTVPVVCAIAPDSEFARAQIDAAMRDKAGPSRWWWSWTEDNLAALSYLPSPEDVARAVSALNIPLASVAQVRLFLAATGFLGVDRIAGSICAVANPKLAERMASVLAVARGPQTAPAMLDVLMGSKAPQVARAWFSDHPEFAARGLLPIAAEPGGRGDEARLVLRALDRLGHREIVDAERAKRPDADALRPLVFWSAPFSGLSGDETPGWLRDALAGNLTMPDAPADENPPRRVRFDPVNLPVPPPGPHEFVPLPEPKPFDFETRLAKLLNVYASTGKTRVQGPPKGRQYPLPMARDTARFCLIAHEIALGCVGTPGLTLAEFEAALRATWDADADAFRPECLPDLETRYPPELVTAAWVAFGPERLIPRLLTRHFGGIKDFVHQVSPSLDESARQSVCRVALETFPDTPPEPGSRTGSVNMRFDALFGLFDSLGATSDHSSSAVDALIRRGEPHSENSRPQIKARHLLRLSRRDEVLAAAARLNVHVDSEKDAARWLGVTGDAGIEAVIRSAKILLKIDSGNEMLRVLNQIEAPEVAPLMLARYQHRNVPTIAWRWLQRFPAHAIDAVAPMLLESGKDARLAREFLRDLKNRGLRWLIERRAESMKPDVAAAVRAEILDFVPAPPHLSRDDVRLAAWLPPLVVTTEAGELRSLTLPQTARVLFELEHNSSDTISPLLVALRDRAESGSADAFAHALLAEWIRAGESPHDVWKLSASGHLGGDLTALALAPRIRAWPDAGRAQYADPGLQALRAINSDTTLMLIESLAHDVGPATVKRRAAELFDAIAAERGLSPEKLSDQTVPDCGVDARGEYVLDFGPRRFTLTVSPELSPILRDNSGERLTDLPEPEGGDDPAKAHAAVAAWALVRARLADVAACQSSRLERAMVSGRRWTLAEFHAVFLSHPILSRIARHLIWGAYDSSGRLTTSFRVREDDAYSGETDESVALSGRVATVGVVHPLHLPESSRRAWSDLLADYHVTQPFVQIGRAVFTLTPDELAGSTITRLAGPGPTDPRGWLDGLKALGWARCHCGGRGVLHERAFGPDGPIASVAGDGHCDDPDVSKWTPITVREIAFRPAPESKKTLLLSSIDPVIVSEVIRDIAHAVVAP